MACDNRLTAAELAQKLRREARAATHGAKDAPGVKKNCFTIPHAAREPLANSSMVSPPSTKYTPNLSAVRARSPNVVIEARRRVRPAVLETPGPGYYAPPPLPRPKLHVCALPRDTSASLRRAAQTPEPLFVDPKPFGQCKGGKISATLPRFQPPPKSTTPGPGEYTTNPSPVTRAPGPSFGKLSTRASKQSRRALQPAAEGFAPPGAFDRCCSPGLSFAAASRIAHRLGEDWRTFGGHDAAREDHRAAADMRFLAATRQEIARYRVMRSLE